MAYPQEWSFDALMAIRSYAGRLRYCEQYLQKLGSGSSRTVYRVDDEKVLKVAKNDKGIAQNAAESDWSLQDYDIIAKVFERDGDGVFLEMELAKKVSPSRFKALSGISLEDLHRALLSENDRLNPTKYTYHNPTYEALAEKLWNESEFFQSLMSMVSNYGYPIPGDFTRASTWGEVLRDGQPTLVLIDFGLNEATKEEHYSGRKGRR